MGGFFFARRSFGEGSKVIFGVTFMVSLLFSVVNENYFRFEGYFSAVIEKDFRYRGYSSAVNENSGRYRVVSF